MFGFGIFSLSFYTHSTEMLNEAADNEGFLTLMFHNKNFVSVAVGGNLFVWFI